MVDLATYRCRIGSFYRVRWIFDTSTLRTVGAVGFIGLLLFCSGIELNPGPRAHLEQDDLSTTLIPCSWLSQNEGRNYRATKCSGNGNCLFNSCSIHITGDESLADELRVHVSRELEKNAAMYCPSTHPYIKFVTEKNEFSEDEVLVMYQIMLNEHDLSRETLTNAIKNEGIRTGIEKRWCSILHLMALSSVLNKSVTSLYPDVPWCYRDLYHGVIYPVSSTVHFAFQEDVLNRDSFIFLWSRDGNLSNTDSIFIANHVVPVFQISHKRLAEDVQIIEQTNIAPAKKLKQTNLNCFIQQRPICSSATDTDILPQSTDEFPDRSSAKTIIQENTTDERNMSDIPTSSSIVQHSVQETCPDLALLISQRCQLADDQKNAILKYPSERLQTYLATGDKKKRRYNQNWEQTFSWLRYSSSVNGVFCGPCFVFAGATTHHAELVSKAWNDWKNAVGSKRGVLNRHNVSKLHTESHALSASFVSVCDMKVPSISQSLSSAYEDKITQNRNLLKTIIDIIIKLSRRGIALRGSWDKSTKREDSNFNFFIDWLSTYEPTLENHLKTAAKNAKYLSPQTQNELIDCTGDYIRGKIVNSINKAKFFSIMADETTDSGTTEQLSICARYFDSSKNEVCEDFLGFVQLPRTDAETITNAMISALRTWKLQLSKWRGKGFDGAATMSGNISGVQKRITEIYPHAKYFTHCKSHCLNLVIVSSCTKVPEIRNFMNTFKELTLFFKYSAKRKEILKTAMRSTSKSNDLLEDCINDAEETLFLTSSARQSLPTLSDTRWLSRVDSLGTLLVHFENIVEALQEIKDTSTGQSAYDSTSFLQAMAKFEFIISAVLTQHILGFIRPLSVNLQAKDCDLLKAHTEARKIYHVLKKLRSEDGTWEYLFSRAEHIAHTINVIPCKPRTVGRQKHRANSSNSESANEYFRINYFYPFLDHILQHINDRFPEELHDVLNGCLLLPGNIKLLTTDLELSIKNIFSEEMPFINEFDQELIRWKNAVSTIEEPTSLIEGLQKC